MWVEVKGLIELRCVYKIHTNLQVGFLPRLSVSYEQTQKCCSEKQKIL